MTTDQKTAAMTSSPSSRRFTFILIKPTHYDDRGYPIQWLRSALPSNTLACMNSLAEDARHREVLGPDVDFAIETYDETNRRVLSSRIIRDLALRGGRALVGLVGVQSNQYPRALDIARPFRAAGHFGLHRRLSRFRLHRHASGHAGRTQGGAGDIGISLFAGEAEEAGSTRCCATPGGGKLKPLYNYMDDLPALEGEPRAVPAAQASCARPPAPITSFDARPRLPVPMLVLHHHQRAGPQERASARPTTSSRSSARTGRRASTGSSSPTTISPATRDWEPIFDRLIALREDEGIRVGFTIQVDTLCHKIPNFIEKATKAGVKRRVYRP